MLVEIQYDEQLSKRNLLGKEYIITDLIPKFKKDQKQKAKDEVQERLFNIFKKYV